MLVKEVMSSPAQTVRADTPIKQALALLDQHSITALPVVDGGLPDPADRAGGVPRSRGQPGRGPKKLS